MTTSLTKHAPLAPSSAVAGVRLGAAASLLGSLAFISTVASTADLSPRESFLLPLGVAGCVIASVGLVLLILSVPQLLTDVPRWVLNSVTVALVFTLALAWFDATAVLGIATETTDDTFDDVGASFGLIAFMSPKAAFGIVGFGALAITGLRRGALSKVSAGLIGVGALLFALPPFPPGLVLVSLGLLVAARR